MNILQTILAMSSLALLPILPTAHAAIGRP